MNTFFWIFAGGYERLARARGGSSGSAAEDIFGEDGDIEKNGSSIWDMGLGPSASNVSTVPQSSVNADDGEFDMFGDEDENIDPSKAQTGMKLAYLFFLSSLTTCFMGYTDELVTTCHYIWLIGSLVLTNLASTLTMHGDICVLHSSGA